jgi:hypothetical protein
MADEDDLGIVGVVEDVEQVGDGLVPVDEGRLAPAAAFVRFHAVGHSPGPLGLPGEQARLSSHGPWDASFTRPLAFSNR